MYEYILGYNVKGTWHHCI